MTVFTFTWNGTFESQPADVEDASLGALRIRNFKVAVSERLKIDHSWLGDGNDGKHNKVTLSVQVGDPTLDTNDIALYAKQVNGKTELFIKDNNNNVIQMTSSGNLKAESFDTNTKMVFYQAAAPTGWSLVSTVHDKVLRVVDGTNGVGGANGGNWTISGLQVTIAGHALTIAEMPVHDHTYNSSPFDRDHPSGGSGQGSGPIIATTAPSGGGAAHGHPGSTAVGDGNWRPAYANVIVASKNAPV